MASDLSGPRSENDFTLNLNLNRDRADRAPQENDE